MASDLSGVVVCVENSANLAKNEEKNEYSCSGILLSAKHGIVLTSASVLTHLKTENGSKNGKTNKTGSTVRHQNTETIAQDASRVVVDLGGPPQEDERGGNRAIDTSDGVDFDFDLPCLSFSVITSLGDTQHQPPTNPDNVSTESAFRLVKHWKYELEPWVPSMEKPGYLKMPAQVLGMWNFGELEKHLNQILRDSVTVSEPDSEASVGGGDSERSLRKLMSSFLLLQIHPAPLSSLTQNSLNNNSNNANMTNTTMNNKPPTPSLSGASASLTKQDCRSAIVERFSLPPEVTKVGGQTLYTLTDDAHSPKSAAPAFLNQQQSLEYRNLKMKALYEIVREAWTSTAAASRGQVVWSESSLFGDLSPSIFMNSLSRGVVVNTHGPLIITDARCAPGSEGGILFAQQSQSKTQQSRLWVGIIFAPLSWKQSDLIGFTLACSARPLLADLLQKCRCLPFPQPAPPLGYCATPLTAGMWSVVLVKVGSTWGSGIVIDRAARLVLTCAHVVKGASTVLVKVEYPVAQTLKCHVLYQTPSGEALDLALLKLPNGALVEQAVYKPKGPALGEEVFAIGHAVFPDYCKTGVLVTSGVVSKVVSRAQVPVLMQTSCAVYAGASGGAVVAADSGVLLGMVTCNSRDLTSSTTYPHINLAIPLVAVMPVIQEYVETQDVKILSRLHFKGDNIKELWNISNNAKGLSRL